MNTKGGLTKEIPRCRKCSKRYVPERAYQGHGTGNQEGTPFYHYPGTLYPNGFTALSSTPKLQQCAPQSF